MDSLIPVWTIAFVNFNANIDHPVAAKQRLVQHFQMQPTISCGPSSIGASMDIPGCASSSSSSSEHTPPFSEKLTTRFAELQRYSVVLLECAPTSEILTITSTSIEKWAHLIKHMHEYTLATIPVFYQDEKFRDAIQRVTYETMTPGQDDKN